MSRAIEGPLSGVRVLDLSRLLPGPYATQILADFGAEIIKIEDVRTGDGFRSAQPQINGASLRFLALNRSKRCLAVDLKKPEGREIFLELSKDADVILEQFRPGVMARLGLGYDDIRRINPKIVYCSLSGFGQSGPLRDLAAHDPNYLALSGILSLIGARGGPPVLTGVQLADISGALMATIGILIALRRAEQQGAGELVDVSLFDSVLSTAVTAASVFFKTGEAPLRGDERHSGRYPMSDVYRTADDQYVTISAIEDHFWTNFCNAVGHPEWIARHYAEGPEAEELREDMRQLFKSRTRDGWVSFFEGKDVCVAPVLTLGEAIESGQARHRGGTLDHTHPLGGQTRVLANPIKMRSHIPDAGTPAGRLGEHSRSILQEIGFPSVRIEELIERGIIAAPQSDT